MSGGNSTRNGEEDENSVVDSSSSGHGLSFSQRFRRIASRRLPILEWGPKYTAAKLVSDVIAGISVGLTVVPQSLAYAAIAGLSPEFGLYSSYVGAIFYVFLGSCRQVTIGPTAVMGLLAYETCGPNFPPCILLMGFWAGVVEILMAVLRLGWVVNLISEPVVIGFTAGAATTIISSQIRSLLGLSGPHGNGFLGYWRAIVQNIDSISLGDTTVACVSILVLLCLRKLRDLKVPEGLQKVVWFLSISRNASVVVSTAIIAYLWPPQTLPFQLTGEVVGGFPRVAFPSFCLPLRNATTESDTSLSFWGTLSFMGFGPFVVALVAILQNVAISKVFGNGQSVDAAQEMLALGVSNVFGSFVSSMPISGSFSRSAVNESSGVTSQLGGLFTGVLVLLSLGLLTPSFYYIPRASLSAVIVIALVFMVEFKALGVMWKISKVDLLSCLTTFGASILLGMEWGILVGVAMGLVNLALRTMRPSLQVEIRSDPVPFIYVKPSRRGGLNFPSVDFVRTSLVKVGRKYPDIPLLVISFEGWKDHDYTAVTALASLIKRGVEGKKVILTNASPGWIRALKKSGELVPEENIHHCSSSEGLEEYLQRASFTSPKEGGTSSSSQSHPGESTLVSLYQQEQDDNPDEDEEEDAIIAIATKSSQSLQPHTPLLQQKR